MKGQFLWMLFWICLFNAFLSVSALQLYIFGAVSGINNTNLNQHYFHPIVVSSNASTSQTVSFNQSAGSIPLFTSDLAGWTAFPLDDTRANLPTFQIFSGNIQYVSIDMLSSPFGIRVHWPFPYFFDPDSSLSRGGARTIYVEQQDSYYGSIGVNNIGGNGNTFVLTIFNNILTPNVSSQYLEPVYTQSWNIGSDTIGVAPNAVDQKNQLFFICLSETTWTGEQGLLFVYDVQKNTMVKNVTYPNGGGSFHAYYSNLRNTLYTYRIDDNGLVEGIDIFDWNRGNVTNIIPASSLPSSKSIPGSSEISHHFDEKTGELYFLSQLQDHTTELWQTWAWSVNVDSCTVSDVVSLVYDNKMTNVWGIFAAQSGSSSSSSSSASLQVSDLEAEKFEYTKKIRRKISFSS